MVFVKPPYLYGMKRFTQMLVAVLALGPTVVGLGAAQTYIVVDTGQTKCYNNRGEIAPPAPGQPFYGQDAQFQHHPACYSLSLDGLTVIDNTTSLIWQRSPDTDGDGVLTARDKLTFSQAQAFPAKLNAAKFGGFSDWRLPSIKELYSLFDASGIDPSGPPGRSASGQKPYINTNYFKFAYGDTSAGERVIDSQWATSTKYGGWSARGGGKMFGVNFADGRIKGYDLKMPGGKEKTFFVLCVRGNPNYGKNNFHDEGNGVITDCATGLVWSKADSGRGMNWQEALAWAQQKNAEKFLGHGDWRLPSVKELQSIVDYSRSSDATQSPAIDPVFKCTAITNETGEADFPFYWSATTHVGMRGGEDAAYVAFGRASGWMPPPRFGGRLGQDGPPDGPPPEAGSRGGDAGDYHFLDVHGAGAQRTDPKRGYPTMFPHGRGPQGDVIRIYNYVRLVRNTAE